MSSEGGDSGLAARDHPSDVCCPAYVLSYHRAGGSLARRLLFWSLLWFLGSVFSAVTD